MQLIRKLREPFSGLFLKDPGICVIACQPLGISEWRILRQRSD